jgi:hypothetical protein
MYKKRGCNFQCGIKSGDNLRKSKNLTRNKKEKHKMKMNEKEIMTCRQSQTAWRYRRLMMKITPKMTSTSGEKKDKKERNKDGEQD